MSDNGFTPPAVENYRVQGARHSRAAILSRARINRAERRMPIVLTTTALLVATVLLLVLAASARSEERPFIWPTNNEIAESEGPWAPLGAEPPAETTELTTSTAKEPEDDTYPSVGEQFQ